MKDVITDRVDIERFAEQNGLQEMLSRYPDLLRRAALAAAKAAAGTVVPPACTGTTEAAHPFAPIGRRDD